MNRLLAYLIAFIVLTPGALGASPDADEAIKPLRRAFDNLYRSIQNVGGMEETDKPAIRTLRERFTQFNQENAGHRLGLSYELQLALWLEEDDRIEPLFAALFEIEPRRELGISWADYYLSREDYSRADRAYNRLLEVFPDDPQQRIDYAEKLQQRNLYARALEIMGRQEWDYQQYPDAAAILSDCLFAQHQFEEAVATLEAIPAAEELPIEKRYIKQKAETSLAEMRSYIEYWSVEQAVRAAEAEADDLPRAQIIVTGGGIIVLELFENEAPNTVANFIKLAEDKFYHGSAFHRVIPNFMAQGGDPYTKPGASGVPGQGNPGYFIADEFTEPGARKHFAGSLAMAKSPLPNSAGCQFYLTHTPTSWLNGKHTVFGRVLEGLSVVRNIKQGDRIEAVMILRKRDHAYEPVKLDLTTGPMPIELNQPVEGVVDIPPLPTQPPPGLPGGGPPTTPPGG